MCPRGDDPDTVHQHDFTIVLDTGTAGVLGGGGGALSGSFNLWWTGQTSTVGLEADAFTGTEAQCEQAFESLPQLKDVQCLIDMLNATSSTWSCAVCLRGCRAALFLSAVFYGSRVCASACNRRSPLLCARTRVEPGNVHEQLAQPRRGAAPARHCVRPQVRLECRCLARRVRRPTPHTRLMHLAAPLWPILEHQRASCNRSTGRCPRLGITPALKTTSLS